MVTLTPIHLIPLAIGATALIVDVIFGLRNAWEKRRAQEKMVGEGYGNGYLTRLVRRDIRREAMRIAKHAVLLFLIVASFTHIEFSMPERNASIAAVMGIMLINSLLDIRDDRYLSNYPVPTK